MPHGLDPSQGPAFLHLKLSRFCLHVVDAEPLRLQIDDNTLDATQPSTSAIEGALPDLGSPRSSLTDIAEVAGNLTGRLALQLLRFDGVGMLDAPGLLPVLMHPCCCMPPYAAAQPFGRLPVPRIQIHSSGIM